MQNYKAKFQKLVDWIKRNKGEFVILSLILTVGAFLRLYRISEYMTFLGDEGRDAIIVRRLLVFRDPILIGPGTSIGNMYLGPLYYYLMAPALFLARFSPAGPSIQIALLGSITIGMIYFIAREWFGRVAAWVAASLYAVSPVVILYSRSSWNPNIMPFFALICIYSIWQVWHKQNFRWLIVLGIAYAFVLQSHYLGLLLAPTLLLFWVLTWRNLKLNGKWKTENGKFWRHSLIGLFLFLFLMSPLIIFDARHNWINVSAMKKFFSERQTTVSARPWNAIPKTYPLFEKVNTRLLAGRNETVGKIVSLAILLGIFSLFSTVLHSSRLSPSYKLLLTWLGFALLGLGLYKQEIYDHYYGFFFAAPFLLLGGLAQYLVTSDRRQVTRYIVLVTTSSLILINLFHSHLREFPQRQMQRARAVSEKIAQETGGAPFNLAVIAERNYEDGYQYFLELNGSPVIDIDAQRPETTTQRLFVVCEMPKEKCDPTHNAKAEVANFGWSKIEKEWEVFGTTIFKLVHTQ